MFKTDLSETRLIGLKNTYRLNKPLIWNDSTNQIIVPAGFIYNGGNVPTLLSWILPAKGSKADRAFCLHDFLYATKLYSRKDSDQLMRKAMRSDQLSMLKRKTAYGLVRLFGWRNWNKNKKEEVQSIRAWALSQSQDLYFNDDLKQT